MHPELCGIRNHWESINYSGKTIYWGSVISTVTPETTSFQEGAHAWVPAPGEFSDKTEELADLTRDILAQHVQLGKDYKHIFLQQEDSIICVIIYMAFDA